MNYQKLKLSGGHMKCIFAIDVGGTNIKFGKFVDDVLVESFQHKTHSNPDDPINSIVYQIVNTIVDNLGDMELAGVGIGVPGPVVDGVVKGAQNIYWEEVYLEDSLKEAFKEKGFEDLKIKLLNDANAATLGEWYYGKGEQTPNMVFVTLGTGIGSGIIINGKLFEGYTGSAGEVGHIKIFPFDGRPCSCGLSGCLEQYASATGITKTAYGMIKNGDTVLKNKKHLNCKEIFDAAYAGDKIANDIVVKSAYYLAIGLANIANTLNPNKIILGGGVSKAGDILLDNVKKYFNDFAFYSITNTEIELASLQNEAGIYGCFYAVKEL